MFIAKISNVIISNLFLMFIKILLFSVLNYAKKCKSKALAFALFWGQKIHLLNALVLTIELELVLSPEHDAKTYL